MAKKFGGLGKGLDKIFTETGIGEWSAPADPTTVSTVRLSDIEPDRDQPRKTFDQEALQALADSIAAHGVLQPLVVRSAARPDDSESTKELLRGKYRIISGERRWRASKMAGLTEVPVVVKELSDTEASAVMLVENLQREDLNPVEEAAAIRFLMEQHDLTQEEVAQRISKSRPVVANSLRLLTLPKSIQTLMKEGKLSAGHGKILAGLEDKKQAEELGKRAAEENWSVRRLEDTLRLLNANRSRKKTGDPYLRRMAGAFRSRLGARVAINGDQQKGKIVISYYSPEDLDAIYEAILGREEE